MGGNAGALARASASGRDGWAGSDCFDEAEFFDGRDQNSQAFRLILVFETSAKTRMSPEASGYVKRFLVLRGR